MHNGRWTGFSPRGTAPMTIALTMLVALLAACANEHTEAEDNPARRVASHPLRRDIAVTREYVCQVQVSRHIDVRALERALERGYIERVAVNEGQRVRAGQLMFQIQPLTYQAELQRATAEVAAARVEYENTKKLADGNVVAPSELALAEAHYPKAQADENLAAAHLGFTTIKAPFDGLMDRLHVREGSLVEEGEFLTTLADNSRMWVYVNVPESEYLDYASRPTDERAHAVRLRMANDKLFEETGTVTVIEADFNNETGTIPFRADFPNPKRLLRHGQTCNILLESPEPGALLIPQKATFEVLDHNYVFVIGTDGTVSPLGRREHAEYLWMSPLSGQESRCLVRHLLYLDDDLAERVTVRSGGNPLHATQWGGLGESGRDACRHQRIRAATTGSSGHSARPAGRVGAAGGKERWRTEDYATALELTSLHGRALDALRAAPRRLHAGGGPMATGAGLCAPRGAEPSRGDGVQRPRRGAARTWRDRTLPRGGPTWRHAQESG